MNINFTSFTLKDILLLKQWLSHPHVKEFWQESEEEQELIEKYTKKLYQRGISPQIIRIDNEPIGYIQSYQANLVGGGWWPDADEYTFGMDLFIGEHTLINKGVGVLVIKQFILKLFQNPQVRIIIIDPEPHNVRAIRAYGKVGFKAQSIITTPGGKALLMSCSKE